MAWKKLTSTADSLEESVIIQSTEVSSIEDRGDYRIIRMKNRSVYGVVETLEEITA